MTAEHTLEIIQYLQNIQDILIVIVILFVGYFIRIIFKGLFSLIGSFF